MWKSIHILVYPGYALLVLHIGLGAMQEDNTGTLPVLVIGSVAVVSGLHCYAALFASNQKKALEAGGDWVEVGPWQEIANDQGITISVGADERVAIFRFDENKLCAVSNVCRHQNGPLGEGRIIDGCITCPWHGYQYRPEDGCSPPPFTEKIETYRLKLNGDMVYLDPKALGPGTARPITEIDMGR
jgi:nitrite reductase/ring-hydroxylating ferredoxin subunit